jgi:hypothetical protein
LERASLELPIAKLTAVLPPFRRRARVSQQLSPPRRWRLAQTAVAKPDGMVNKE